MSEQIMELRLLIAEPIPPDGTEDDTLFTDAQLQLWIDASPNIERAAHDGWRTKAGLFANLVSVTDGAASREFSDLLTNAIRMVSLYSRSSQGATEGRARVGRIVRQ